MNNTSVNKDSQSPGQPHSDCKRSIKRFQEIATVLLKQHYGLALSDTQLHDENAVSACIIEGVHPYQAVAEHAEQADLDRTDLEGAYLAPSKARLTAADEHAALQHLPIASIQYANCMNDYVKAASMYEAFTKGCGSMCFQSLDETLGMYKPSRRAEGWFRKMLENDRGYLTEEEQAFVLNDRYGDMIIGDRHAEYDGLEVQGVRDHHLPGNPEGSCCEVDNANPQFFSVYAHLKAGGIDCVGDFQHCSLADDYANELAASHHWPVCNFVPEQLR